MTFEKATFGTLHKWTFGRFWKNLIILVRTKFYRQEVESRARNDQSLWTKYQEKDFPERNKCFFQFI